MIQWLVHRFSFFWLLLKGSGYKEICVSKRICISWKNFALSDTRRDILMRASFAECLSKICRDFINRNSLAWITQISLTKSIFVVRF